MSMSKEATRTYNGLTKCSTSNKSFSEWGELFTDQVLATALLDRLLHHSSIINIRGQSYRLKEKRQSGLFQGTDAIKEPVTS
jgi:DNA replication protein DnaC